MPSSSLIRRGLGAACSALLLLIAACGDDTGGGPAARQVARIDVDVAPVRAVFVGQSTTPRVRAVDADGFPVPGVALRFATTRGTTTLASTTATTDALGYASPGSWQFPTRPTFDTLVVSLAATSSVAPLRIPLEVRAGPVATITRLAAEDGTGIVGTSMLSGPAFLLEDQYDNPMAGAAVTVRPMPVPTATFPARAAIEADTVADANGIVRVARWVPRTLGVHELVAVVRDGPTSPVLRRTVASPTCSPIAVLPSPDTIGANEIQTVAGALGADVGAPCADTVDRYVMAFDSVRVTRLTARRTSDNALVPITVHRLRADGTVEVMVPSLAGELTFVLPAGEYEVRVGGGAATGAYRLTVYNRIRSARINTWCALVFTARGVDATFMGGCFASRPGDTELRFGRELIVPMRLAASRELQVAVEMEQWVPTIEVYGQRDGSTALLPLSSVAGTGNTASLAVTVPPEFQQAVVRITRPAPTVYTGPEAFETRFRAVIN